MRHEARRGAGECQASYLFARWLIFPSGSVFLLFFSGGNLFGLFHESWSPAAFRGPRRRLCHTCTLHMHYAQPSSSPLRGFCLPLIIACTCKQQRTCRLPLSSHVHTNHTPSRSHHCGLNMHVLHPNHRLFPKCSIRGTAQPTMTVMMCCWAHGTAGRRWPMLRFPHIPVSSILFFPGQTLQLERCRNLFTDSSKQVECCHTLIKCDANVSFGKLQNYIFRMFMWSGLDWINLVAGCLDKCSKGRLPSEAETRKQTFVSQFSKLVLMFFSDLCDC